MNGNKKIIIGLVGQMASGKGTIADYMKEKHNASTYTFSQMLRDVLERIHQDITRENLQKLSTILRKSFDEDLLASVMATDVLDDKNEIIVVDGVRRFADIKYLQKIDGFVLAKIDVDQKTRFDRLVKRAQNAGDSEKTFEEFQNDEAKEADKEIPAVMTRADEKFDNNGTLENLYTQVDNLLKKYE